jgi:hypothetical protein
MKQCIVSVIVCLLTFGTEAQNKNNWPVWLDKTFTKTVPYSNQTLVLNNKFGAMDIQTWDKKEVAVEVVMAVGANSKEVAENALQLISIDEKNTASSVEFTTKFTDNNNGNYWEGNKSNSRELSVQYKVFLPANANLIAENAFGPLQIANYKGIAQLTCKYGNLTADNLLAATKVRVEFGKATIKEANDILLVGKYSRVDIGKVNNVLDAQLDYCQGVDVVVGGNIKKMNINSNYSSVFAVVPKNISGNYSITTNNGRFSNSTSYTFQQINSNSNSYYNPTKKYEGTFGNNATNGVEIKIKSTYGSIKFVGE